MKLIELIQNIRQLYHPDEVQVIYGKRVNGQWEEDSPVEIHLFNEINQEKFIGELEYLLELDLAIESMEVAQAWFGSSKRLTDHQNMLAVIHYAEYDAYISSLDV